MLRNITDEVIHLSNFFICLLNLFVEALIFLTILIVLFYFNFEVTFISTVIILCLSFVLYLLFSKKLKTWGENRRNYTGKFMKTSIQTFNSIKEVKTLNKESYFFKYYYKQLQKAIEATYLHRIVNFLPRYIFEIVTIVMFFLLFVLGALDHSKNNFIILIGVYGYSLYRLLPAANKILINISNIKFTTPSVHNIINEFDLVNNKEIIKEVLIKKKNELDIKNFQSLSLKNLSFSYEKNKNLLKNINFEISKNEIVGIYGESGSGKTTLVNILMGLFNPTSGKIIYNKNIEFNSNLHFTPKTIGCVFQPVNLWDDTIKKNIALGCEEDEIDTKKIDSVIKMSNLSKLIENYDLGLDTGVGNDGVKLSGGQKQRIGLARALYYNPKLLILDEATNSLDKETEKEIMKDITDLTKIDLSLILISHDLNFLKNYSNKIYQLSNNQLNYIK